jgi:hypothetical protein
VKLAAAGGAAEPLAYVLTGDGVTDEKVLGALCEKYDHSFVLAAAGAPLRRSTGLAVVDSLAFLFEKIVRERITVLVLLDREHLTGVEDFVNRLRERGFRVVSEERCGHEGCLLVTVERGGKRGVVVLSVQGREKCIEEDLAELVRLIAGERVEPEEVHEWLKARGYRVSDLIRRASANALEEAFPALTSALKALRALAAPR